MRAHRTRPSRAKPGNATSRGGAGGRARADRQRETPKPRRLPVVDSGWASFFCPTEPGQEDRRRDCLASLERGRKRCRRDGRPVRDACPCGIPGHYVCPTNGEPPTTRAA